MSTNFLTQPQRMEAAPTAATWVDIVDHTDYEMCSTYPHDIRCKATGNIVAEHKRSDGYISVSLNGRNHLKHRLIAIQFIENPLNLPCVDHINHKRDDNQISNLRWVDPSTNARNKSSHLGTRYTFVDDIPDEAIVVDFYETRNGRHEFEGYYYHDGLFYYDNDANYKILNINKTKGGSKMVRMNDINGKPISVYYNLFKKQHDL